MRSEKIHYFRTILREKCFSINLNIGAGPPTQQHVSDKCNVSIFADERSDPLIRSNQIHHIHLIPPQICPFLTGGAEDCDRTNSNFSPAGGFVGGGICFGWVSCHPRRPFNNARWPACPTLEIHETDTNTNTQKCLFGSVNTVAIQQYGAGQGCLLYSLLCV